MRTWGGLEGSGPRGVATRTMGSSLCVRGMPFIHAPVRTHSDTIHPPRVVYARAVPLDESQCLPLSYILYECPYASRYRGAAYLLARPFSSIGTSVNIWLWWRRKPWMVPSYLLVFAR